MLRKLFLYFASKRKVRGDLPEDILRTPTDLGSHGQFPFKSLTSRAFFIYQCALVARTILLFSKSLIFKSDTRATVGTDYLAPAHRSSQYQPLIFSSASPAGFFDMHLPQPNCVYVSLILRITSYIPASVKGLKSQLPPIAR